MSNYIEIEFDRTLGLSGQAMALLALLSDRPMCIEALDETTELLIDAESYAWYNGREKGVCLVVRDHSRSERLGKEKPAASYRKSQPPGSLLDEALYIVFAEHRSSDGIFVDCWLSDRCNLNPPIHNDLTEAAYELRRMFDYGRIDQAERYIRNLIEDYLHDEIGWHCLACGCGGSGETSLQDGKCPCGGEVARVLRSVTSRKLR